MATQEDSQTLSLYDAFKVRHTIHYFEPNEFPSEKMKVVDEILERVNSTPTPFGHDDVKIGRVGPGLGKGRIINEKGWILALIPKSWTKHKKQYYTDVSFRLQLATMLLTENGIGTGWATESFDSSKAKRTYENWKIPAGVAFGLVPQTKFLKVDPITPWNQKRLRFSSLFYNSNTKQFINEKNAGDLYQMLMALRSGPSHKNRQPWRFVIEGKMIHLFNTEKGKNCHMGVALANLYLIAKENGVEPKFDFISPPPNFGSGSGSTPFIPTFYVCSCRFTNNTN